MLHSKLRRRVPLLLDVAQQSSWQSGIYQSSTVSSQTFRCFILLHLFGTSESGWFLSHHCLSVSDDDNIQCSVDALDQHWLCTSARGNFSCTVDDSGSGVSCQDKQHCPFAEESQQIHMMVYLRTDHFLLEIYSKLFFLSEIGERSFEESWFHLTLIDIHVLAHFVFSCSETWQGEDQ